MMIPTRTRSLNQSEDVLGLRRDDIDPGVRMRRLAPQERNQSPDEDGRLRWTETTADDKRSTPRDITRRTVTRRSASPRIAGWLHPPPYVMNPELARSNTMRDLFAKWVDPPWSTGRIDCHEEVIRFKQLQFCA